MAEESLQEAVLGLCEHLLKEHSTGGVTTIDDVVNAMLGWHYDVVDPGEEVVHRQVPVQEKLARLRQLWASQPSDKGQNPARSAIQTESRPAPAGADRRCGARRDSRPLGGDSRPPNELRALELLAQGRNNNEVLSTLRAEGLRLDRNRLKGLRAEARALMT